ALICHGIELEMDLVKATSEVDGECLSIIVSLKALDEAIRQSEVEQGRWRGVKPTGRQIEVACDPVSCIDERQGDGRGSTKVRSERSATMSTSRVGRLIRPRARRADPPITTSSTPALWAASCSPSAVSNSWVRG